MSPQWMPLYIADYRADTAHLSAAEHGAYLLLIMHYWQTCGLPADDRQLARIACMTPAEWKRSRSTIEALFQEGWKHKRIDAELSHANDVIEKRRSAAQQRYSKSDANAVRMETQPQSPLPSKEEKKEDIRAVAKATRPSESQGLWNRFKGNYPKRKGANPWKPAEAKFFAAIKSGIDPEEIIGGAERYGDEVARDGQVGTEFVARALTWLTQQRWTDYPAPSDAAIVAIEQPEGAPSDEELRRLYAVRNQESRGEEVLRGGGGSDGSASLQGVEGDRPKSGGHPAPDDKAGPTGVRSMAGILRDTSPLDALRHAGGPARQRDIDDGPGAMAAMV